MLQSQLTESSFTNVSGQKIYYRSYKPKSGKASKVLVVQHGFGEHAGRYENLVGILEKDSVAIYLLDARGHGRSDGPRGYVEDFEFFVTDLVQLVDIARKEEKVDKVHIFGHSMGSLIVAKLAQNPQYQSKLNTVILSGLAFRVQKDFIMEIKAVIGALLAKLVPKLTIPAGLDANHLSHDKDVVAKYLADPLVHGNISAYLGDFLLTSEPVILGGANRITLPTYIFHGKEDKIALYTASEDFFKSVNASDKKIKIFEGLYHETLNELEKDRQAVLQEFQAWLAAH